MSIKPLPPPVVAQIKSSLAITSLNDVICGLVKNSLDADATKVNLSVDFSRGNCSIEDDGVGIPPSEFNHGGRLGQIHCTSKHPPLPHLHGKDGAFLASVASLSLLSITSHHREYHSHNSLTFHNSKLLARQTPSEPHQRLLTFGNGTRVLVRDLFGIMPVRVKCRALRADKSSLTADWDQLLSSLVALLIAWPGAVCLSVREASSHRRLTLRSAPQFAHSARNCCRLLHQASLCDSPTTAWISIGAEAPTLSVSGHVCRNPVATRRLQFINFGIQPLSNQSHHNLLYEVVNHVFAHSSFGAVDGASNVDGQAGEPKTDRFTRRELKSRKGVDRWPMFILNIAPAAPAAKPLVDVEKVLDERHPSLGLIIDLLKAMFHEFLKKIHCDPAETVRPERLHTPRHRPAGRASDGPELPQSRSESGRTRNLRLLEPRSRPVQPPDMLPTSSDFPFSHLSRIKAGSTLPSFEESWHPPSPTHTAPITPAAGNRDRSRGLHEAKWPRFTTEEPSLPPLYDANGQLTRKPFQDIDPAVPMGIRPTGQLIREPETRNASSMAPNRSFEDEKFEWNNPLTKLASLVNRRTGSTQQQQPLTLSKRASDGRPFKAGETGMRTPIRGPVHRGQRSSWTSDLVSNWKNPVFELTESPVPKLASMTDARGVDLKRASHNGNHACSSLSLATQHERSTLGLQLRLKKDGLRRTRLVSQVDSKFILARVPADRLEAGNKEEVLCKAAPSYLLVLIDQHAADERCRVERLMGEYFRPVNKGDGTSIWEAATEILPNPLTFDLSRKDKTVLSRFKEYFWYWGIGYDVVLHPGEDGFGLKDKPIMNRATDTKANVVIRSLPPAIVDRCRTEPRLVADLIRKEAWRLDDEGSRAQHPTWRPCVPDQDACDSSPAWVSLFHGCPPGIVDLINSRSCRSAIMFNDHLTPEQCTELLDRLARCAFPFQCAHGRPSIVPLLDLGEPMVETEPVAEGLEGGQQRQVSFAQKFRQWKAGARGAEPDESRTLSHTSQA